MQGLKNLFNIKARLWRLPTVGLIAIALIVSSCQTARKAQTEGQGLVKTQPLKAEKKPALKLKTAELIRPSAPDNNYKRSGGTSNKKLWASAPDNKRPALKAKSKAQEGLAPPLKNLSLAQRQTDFSSSFVGQKGDEQKDAGQKKGREQKDAGQKKGREQKDARQEDAKLLVYWDSPQAIERLAQSRFRADFASLANQFQNQTDGMACGPTTGAMVLNALWLGRKKPLPLTAFDKKYKKHLPLGYDPRVMRYTPESFMSQKAQKIKTTAQLYGEPLEGKNDFGLQIRQLHKIFLAHGAKSALRVAVKGLSDQSIREELKANLQRPRDYVVVNYKRSSLGQKGGGHISPLGAYHEKTDSFLIMDVNSAKYSWVWAPSSLLIRSMRTFDTAEQRGWLLIE